MNANGFDSKGFGGSVQSAADPVIDAVSQRARTLFATSTLQLDNDTERRLRDMRLHALRDVATVARKRRWMIPAATTAAVGLAVLLMWPRALQTPEVAPAVASSIATSVPTSISTPTPPLIASDSADTDINDVLLGDNAPDPELLGNLAFYDWLEQQPAMQASGG